MMITTIAADDIETPADYIYQLIRAGFDRSQSVLWLVPGGSAIKVAVRARALLGTLNQEDVLHVGLSDERYGEPHHADSNEEHLAQADFDMSGVSFHTVLTDNDIESTTRQYNNVLQDLFSECDVVIGLLGMGSDGHTAGLLPGNPVMTSQSYVGHFDGFDFKRITITPACIRELGETIVYATGQAKWPVLDELATTELPVSVFRDIQNVTVFTDKSKEDV